jgi:hypothetical protein
MKQMLNQFGAMSRSEQKKVNGGAFGCLKNIYCLDVWRPVCGCNGITYSNDCYARRACVTCYTQGACGGGAI